MIQNTNPAGNPSVTHLNNATTIPTSVGVQVAEVVADREDEFEQFEALTARLVDVPKSELDEQRSA